MANEDKTNYLSVGCPFEVGDYEFKRVGTFIYMRFEINSGNGISQDKESWPPIDATTGWLHTPLHRVPSRNLQGCNLRYSRRRC